MPSRLVGSTHSYHFSPPPTPDLLRAKEVSAQCRTLPPVLEEHVAERLLERYLAEQGHVDLLEKRRAYTRKKIEDLSPEDLPALIEADRQKVEEEHRKGRERAKFVREARAGLERIHVLEPAEEMS